MAHQTEQKQEKTWNERAKDEILPYLSKLSDDEKQPLKEVLGDDVNQWKVKELVGAIGNLNYIYIIEGPKGHVLMKWAPPYVKCVGESWPLDPKRSEFELDSLLIFGKIVPNYVPKIYHSNRQTAMIIMEYLDDCINFRNGKLRTKD